MACFMCMTGRDRKGRVVWCGARWNAMRARRYDREAESFTSKVKPSFFPATQERWAGTWDWDPSYVAKPLRSLCEALNVTHLRRLGQDLFSFSPGGAPSSQARARCLLPMITSWYFAIVIVTCIHPLFPCVYLYSVTRHVGILRRQKRWELIRFWMTGSRLSDGA